jgi:hypothetical protein
MALEAIDSVLQQIDDLVRRTGGGGLVFRLRLEELVRQGGRATENAIAHYITGRAVGVAARIDLVRMAGYIRSDAFLLPLQRVIELGEDDLLREQAILSIAKYNDRRALDILAAALKKIRKPQLQETISQAIERIKESSTLMAMLPRFLRGGRGSELFQVTLKVFKKTLTPVEARTFIAYLHHGDQGVSEGSFEILCARGDEAVYFFVAEYFREHGRLLLRGADGRVGAARLAALAAALRGYLERFPQYLEPLRPDILYLRDQAGDAAWGKVLSELLSLRVPGEAAPPSPEAGECAGAAPEAP